MEILPLSKEFVKNNYKELNDKFNIFFPGYDVRKVAQSIVFYVIHYNDKFVGMFNIFLHSRIQKFFIMPQFHSKGIGSMVIKKIIENKQTRKNKNLQFMKQTQLSLCLIICVFITILNHFQIEKHSNVNRQFYFF